MGFFRKKKAETPVIDPLSLIMQSVDSAMNTALGSVNGEVLSPSGIKLSDDATCRTWLSNAQKQTIALFFHNASSEPCAGLLIPSEILAKNAVDAPAAAESFAAAWIARFPSSWKSSIAYSISPTKEREDAVLWPLLELEAYALSWGTNGAWLFLDPSLKNSLCEGTDISDTTEDTNKFPVSVSRQQDFLALDCFTPKAMIAGKYRCTLTPESFTFLSGSSALTALTPPQGQESAFYLSSFELTGEGEESKGKISAIYSFPKQALKTQTTGQDPEAITNSLATAIFQEAVRQFAKNAKKTPSNPALKKLPAPPDISKSGTILIIRATITGPAFRVPFLLAAPAGTLQPLFRAWIDQSSLKRLALKPEALVLLLNAKMIATRLNEHISPAEFRKKIPQLLVAELFNHLSDSDYDLVLQNCLITSLGAKGLPSLFYYNESVTGEDGIVRERILPLGPFDSRRIFSHMPENFRDDYVAHSGKLHANPATLCISKNIEMMNVILKADSTRRIASSPRLAWLLREFFLKPKRERDEKRLEALKEKGIPFSSLKELPARLAQKALARIDDRDAALTILDAPEQKETLYRFVSTARRNRLDEEIVFLRRQYDAAEIDPEELIRAKQLLVDECKEVLRIEQEEKSSLKAPIPQAVIKPARR